jgi:tRNA-dihydrouridine synthase B
MAGITDVPFRALAWRFGAGYMISEMVGSSARLWETEKSRLRRRASGAGPLAVQIAGGDPETVAGAAVRHWRDGADVIDINFGCPAKKVCRKAAGSQLLGDEGLVARIIAATVGAVPIPVTIKMRTGYSAEQKNAVRIARIAEDLGVAAIAVHGRTRACRFEGPVEHATTAAVKAAVGIPVFANGDIDSAEAARRVLAVTGADGVMIGRAALGAPWLPGQIAGVTAPLTLDARIAVMREHVGLAHEFYGASGARVVRKHVQWYLEKLEDLGDAEWRRTLARSFNSLDAAEEQIRFLDALTRDLAA